MRKIVSSCIMGLLIVGSASSFAGVNSFTGSNGFVIPIDENDSGYEESVDNLIDSLNAELKDINTRILGEQDEDQLEDSFARIKVIKDSISDLEQGRVVTPKKVSLSNEIMEKAEKTQDTILADLKSIPNKLFPDSDTTSSETKGWRDNVLSDYMEEGDMSAPLNILQIIALVTDPDTVKDDINSAVGSLKSLAMSKISPEALSSYLRVAKELKVEYGESIDVLEPASIVSDTTTFNFDTPPVVKDGRTLVPVRAISEAFNAKVLWDADTQSINIEKGDNVLKLILGRKNAFINGELTTLDVSAELIGDRTYVPLRFICEALGVSITWEGVTGTILISE